jgi:hypothetical protein
MDPQSRSGRHGEVKILDTTGPEPRPLSRPARSQSLYRLRYEKRFWPNLSYSFGRLPGGIVENHKNKNCKRDSH